MPDCPCQDSTADGTSSPDSGTDGKCRVESVRRPQICRCAGGKVVRAAGHEGYCPVCRQACIYASGNGKENDIFGHARGKELSGVQTGDRSRQK